jgi:hypothetical protein
MKPKPHRRLPKPRRANPVLHAMGVSARLAALLVALTTPAWAANDGKPVYPDWVRADEECVKNGGNAVLWWIHHVPEPQAQLDAKHMLGECLVGTANRETCEKLRAYAKLRWGY